MHLVVKYQAGFMNEKEFIPLTYVKPFGDQWEAHNWKKQREGNPDGWIPAIMEYYTVEGVPEPKIYT